MFMKGKASLKSFKLKDEFLEGNLLFVVSGDFQGNKYRSQEVMKMVEANNKNEPKQKSEI